MSEGKKARIRVVSRLVEPDGDAHEIKNARSGLLRSTADGWVLEYDDVQDEEKAHIVLTMQPEILALDEPTSNLDPISTERIFQVIAQLNREMGTTVLLVEHEIELLAQYATRILVVHDGAILLDGTPQEVFSRRDIFDGIGLEVPQVTQIAACASEEYGLWTSEALPITMEQLCRRIRGDESGNED